jgi:predicted TIM-barrel enzyme
MIGILPIHDANGRLLDELSAAEFSRVPDFAGVCLSDPFRRLDMILDGVRRAGNKGVVNLPTVAPFLERQTNEAIAALHDTEQQALCYARKRGFDCFFITTTANAKVIGGITFDDLIFPEGKV